MRAERQRERGREDVQVFPELLAHAPEWIIVVLNKRIHKRMRIVKGKSVRFI